MSDRRHSIPLAVKWAAASQEGEFSGYASTFTATPDSYGDIVAPGAFAATLVDNKTPALLWSHDQSQPIGVITNLVEDQHGLRMNGKLTLEVARAAEAHALMKAGALGFSIGYQVKASTRLPGGTRRLDAIKLFEVSCVAIPANTGAKLLSVKTQPSLIDQHSPRTIETILRDGGISWRLARKIAALSKPALKARDVLQADEPITKQLLAAAAAIKHSLQENHNAR